MPRAASPSVEPQQQACSVPSARYGREEPRLFTPPLRELTPKTTLGYEVIGFAEELGVTLHPWQEWLFIHALEQLPSGEFRFDTIVILVARQNGKTWFWKILILYAMYAMGMKLILSTAQDLDTAEETWQSVVDFVLEQDDEENLLRPEMAAEVAKTVLVNGQKSLNLKTGQRYKAKAASRRSGRGLSGNLIGLDEAREQTNWDAWAAITHHHGSRSVADCASLQRRDSRSVVLRYFRKLAHAALGDPDGLNAVEDPAALLASADEDVEIDSIDLFEWSAPPGAAISDRAA